MFKYTKGQLISLLNLCLTFTGIYFKFDSVFVTAASVRTRHSRGGFGGHLVHAILVPKEEQSEEGAKHERNEEMKFINFQICI